MFYAPFKHNIYIHMNVYDLISKQVEFRIEIVFNLLSSIDCSLHYLHTSSSLWVFIIISLDNSSIMGKIFRLYTPWGNYYYLSLFAITENAMAFSSACFEIRLVLRLRNI